MSSNRKDGGNTMASAIDVANYFINEFKDTDDPMTKTRVQKFMYYAQAHCLVRLEHPLFNEDFQAWKFGPYIPEIGMYFQKKSDGEPIKRTVGSYDIHVFSPSEIEVMMDVSRYCGEYSTAALSNKTHVPNGPWASVHRETGSPAIIDKISIQNYYSKHEPIPSVLSDVISKLPREGRKDKDGHLVLPADCDWE